MRSIQDIYSVTFFISTPTVRGVSVSLTEMMLVRTMELTYFSILQKQFSRWQKPAVNIRKPHHLQTDD